MAGEIYNSLPPGTVMDARTMVRVIQEAMAAGDLASVLAAQNNLLLLMRNAQLPGSDDPDPGLFASQNGGYSLDSANQWYATASQWLNSRPTSFQQFAGVPVTAGPDAPITAEQAYQQAEAGITAARQQTTAFAATIVEAYNQMIARNISARQAIGELSTAYPGMDVARIVGFGSIDAKSGGDSPPFSGGPSLTVTGDARIVPDASPDAAPAPSRSGVPMFAIAALALVAFLILKGR